MVMPYGMEHYIFNKKDQIAGYDYQDAYDYIYCATADDKAPLKPLSGESAQLQWVDVKAIKDGSFVVRDQEKGWVTFFSEELEKRLVK